MLEMRKVFTHENVAVLHSARNVLGLSGIESFVKNEHLFTQGARHGIENIFLELWIYNDADYDRAVAIIEDEVVNPEPKGTWICAGCNEENDGSFEVCWNCQAKATNP